jgi:hypothetical protein
VVHLSEEAVVAGLVVVTLQQIRLWLVGLAVNHLPIQRAVAGLSEQTAQVLLPEVLVVQRTLVMEDMAVVVAERQSRLQLMELMAVMVVLEAVVAVVVE